MGFVFADEVEGVVDLDDAGAVGVEVLAIGLQFSVSTNIYIYIGKNLLVGRGEYGVSVGTYGCPCPSRNNLKCGEGRGSG